MDRYRGRSGKEMRCRKHPKHRQSSGVCPSCLRDKLAKLSSSSTSNVYSTTSTTSTTPYSSGSVSSYSSSSSSYSSMASPVHCYAAKAMGRFTKSRSVAREVGKGKDARKKGFWSKMFVGSRGGGEGKIETRT